MKTFSIDDDIAAFLLALQKATGKSISALIRGQFALPDQTRQPESMTSTGSKEGGWQKVYFLYKKKRIDAELNLKNFHLRITSDPLEGSEYDTPSAASVACVRRINPGLDVPSRNGLRDWRTLDGKVIKNLKQD